MKLLHFDLAMVLVSVTPTIGEAASKEAVLHGFDSGNGELIPTAALLSDATCALYGTTSAGGASEVGTVFKMAPPTAGKTAWSFQTLYGFKGGSDGAVPNSGVIAGPSGSLYGTTSGGGHGNWLGLSWGTVFELTTSATAGSPWTETVLYRFRGGADGFLPLGPLPIGSGGVLYGTTGMGGSSDCVYVCGTVYLRDDVARRCVQTGDRIQIHPMTSTKNADGPRSGFLMPLEHGS